MHLDYLNIYYCVADGKPKSSVFLLEYFNCSSKDKAEKAEIQARNFGVFPKPVSHYKCVKF